MQAGTQHSNNKIGNKAGARQGCLALCFASAVSLIKSRLSDKRECRYGNYTLSRKDDQRWQKMKTQIPKYGTITLKGIQYYRTRITDADGKELSLYAATCEELYEKQLEARQQVEEIIFRRQHPTVAEYCEKWLLMQSAKVSASTLRGYTRDMKNLCHQATGRDVYGRSDR